MITVGYQSLARSVNKTYIYHPSSFECGVVHHRDINASLNILKQGLNIKSGSGTDSDYNQKLMEPLSLDKVTKSEAHGSLVRG